MVLKTVDPKNLTKIFFHSLFLIYFVYLAQGLSLTKIKNSSYLTLDISAYLKGI